MVTREALTGISVIRVFGREKYEEERFDKENTVLKNEQLFINRTLISAYANDYTNYEWYCIINNLGWWKKI